MNLTNIYFSSFAFIAVSMAILFCIKSKGDKAANRFMASLLLLFGFYIMYSLLYWNRQIRNMVHLNITYIIPISLFGTLFYLYVRRILLKNNLNRKDLFHFIPFIIMVISSYRYFFQSGSTKIIIAKNKNRSLADYLLLPNTLDLILVAFMFIYGILAYNLYSKVKAEDKDINIWVKTISILYLGLSVSFIIYYSFAFSQSLSPNQDYFISFMMTIFIGLVGYFAFMQPDIFNGKPIEEIIPFVKKYQKTGLSREHSLALKIKLIKAMDNDQLYLRNDLGLMDIADKLKVSRNHASQIINEHFNMSFYDFINKFRIIEAEKMINDNLNLSFAEIAYTVGFNNRISFYKAFKKFTGLNPSQYIENHHAS